MEKPRSRGFRPAALVSLCSALLFAVAGYISHGFSLAAALEGAVIGALLGIVAAPELAPASFRHPVLWQMGASVAGCVLIAIMLGAGADGYVLAVIGGMLIGYLAPLWIRHVNLP